MPVSQARVPTENASSYLQKLCKHWTHKFKVEFTSASGQIAFNDDDRLTLDASDGILTLHLESPSPDQLKRLEEVVANHLIRFAFRETLTIDWQPSSQ